MFVIQESSMINVWAFGIGRGPFRDHAEFLYTRLSLDASQTLKPFSQSLSHHMGHGFSGFLNYRCRETMRLGILDIKRAHGNRFL
jgi:hypothetical protein